MRILNASRSRDYLYSATPPPPDLGPAAAPRARDNATAQRLPPPPPPDLGPQASGEHTFIPQQIATINSHASTHLSEFDLLAPLGQSARMPTNFGPPPAEEDELEYTDAPTEPIPRQPIASEPPIQRRHARVAVSVCVSVSESLLLIASCRNDRLGVRRAHEILLCLRR